MQIEIFPDHQTLIQSAAKRFLDAAAAAILQDGICRAVLAGGGTPQPLYEHLAGDRSADSLEWSRVHFYWGDERNVPPDHPDSNYGLAERALLKPRKIPAGNIHRIAGELEPLQAAAQYQEEIISLHQGSPPRFDLVLLGMGEDGHTASLFPGTRPVTHPDQFAWVAAYWVPQLGSWRITLMPGLLNQARDIFFLVSGGKKAAVLQQVLEGPCLPQQYPSQLIQPAAGELTWLLDREAASKLESTPGPQGRPGGRST